MTMRRRWSGLAPWAKWVIGIFVAVVALNLALTAVNNLYAGPEGPPSSSYATAPEGTAAYAELLAHRGHPVVPLRGPLTDGLPPGGVLVVLDPRVITRDEVAALRRWVSNGGRLVIGGRPELWVRSLLDDAPRWSPAGVLSGHPLVEVPETQGISTIGGAGYGTWEDAGGALPLVGLETSSARTLVAVAAIGSGRAVLLADTTIVHNRFLAHADNAAFGLNIAGPERGPVYFAEGVHGYGSETGFAAIPLRWRFALGGLGLAAIVWMVAVGRRLGPPEPDARDLPPPRRTYVEALSTTLARTKRPDDVVAPVRAAARAKIARRVGLEADTGSHALEGAGRALGLTEAELAAVLGKSPGDVMNLGRALTKLGGRDW